MSLLRPSHAAAYSVYLDKIQNTDPPRFSSFPPEGDFFVIPLD
ncbi:hypothetical protein V2O64_25640 (plasmid) [Verrucomicrobiaceae bacterium 227]